MPGIRAVIFDVYGTLFSSGVGDISLAAEGDRTAALRATLTDAGYPLNCKRAEVRMDTRFHDWIRRHQEERKQDGTTHPEVEIRAVWRDFLAELEAEQWINSVATGIDIDKLAVEYESRVNPTRPMPGLAATLQALKVGPWKLGVISNAQFFTPLLFDAFLPGGFAACGFEEALCIWSYRMLEAKPSVHLFHACAESLVTRHGITPGEALYIGNDIRNDIRPAREAGFRTALFAGDKLSLRRREDDPACADVVADLEITDLEQVLDCI